MITSQVGLSVIERNALVEHSIELHAYVQDGHRVTTTKPFEYCETGSATTATPVPLSYPLCLHKFTIWCYSTLLGRYAGMLLNAVVPR